MEQHIYVFKKLIKHCFSAGKILTVLLSVSSAILGLLSTIQLWVVGQLVNDISISTNRNQYLIAHLVLLFLCYFAQKLCFAFIPYLRSKLITKIKSNMKINLYSAIDDIPPVVQEENDMQVKIGRALDFINSNLETSIRSIIVYISSIVSVVSVTILLAKYSVIFPIISIITTIPIIIIRLKQDSDMHKMYKEQYSDNQLANYYLNSLTSKDNFLEVMVYGAIDLFRKRYLTISKNNMKKRTNYFIKYVSTWSMVEACLITIGNVVSIIIAIYLLSSSPGMFTLGTLSIIISGIFSAQNDIIGFAFNSKYIYQATVYGEDYWEIIKRNSPNLRNRPHYSDIESIELKNVTFQYPNSNMDALNRINLTIRKGETIGLVGENGSGKTTLSKIILGIYQPTLGEVILHKNSGKEVSAAIGVVFQDFNKYELTPKENIYFSNVDKSENQSNIESAAKKAGAHAFITQLQKGYNTNIGTYFSNSTLLSGGEWQRLAVARGFFAEGDLFVLDEPNSSLDAKIEAELYEKYKTVVAENKCISCFISHRLGATKLCDKIIVLDKGAIVETGTFDDLMRKKGKYNEMFIAQASLYSNN